jgi:hypothetical protein
LTTRELARKTREQFVQPENAGRLPDTLVDDRLRLLGQHERERHVVTHGHVRVQGVVLENHGDVALFGRHLVDDLVANTDGAAGDFLEASNHAQKSGLATTRRTNQHTELTIFDLDRDPLDDVGLTKVLLYSVNRH